MNATLPIQLRSKETLRTIAFDLSAVLFIYFIPAISHMLNAPVYFIEPMRIALVLALLHTTKRNAYVLAITLPIFSFLVSAHPMFAKMLIITAELTLNVFLFYYLLNKLKSAPLAILTSIVLSKAFYYAIKFLLINFAIASLGMVGIPILMQVLMTLVFTAYCWVIFQKKAPATK
ncbi:MAG: hypothetical protein ACLFNJ_09785 [Bacteroidales bacterium]